MGKGRIHSSTETYFRADTTTFFKQQSSSDTTKDTLLGNIKTRLEFELTIQTLTQYQLMHAFQAKFSSSFN